MCILCVARRRVRFITLSDIKFKLYECVFHLFEKLFFCKNSLSEGVVRTLNNIKNKLNVIKNTLNVIKNKLIHLL